MHRARPGSCIAFAVRGESNDHYRRRCRHNGMIFDVFASLAKQKKFHAVVKFRLADDPTVQTQYAQQLTTLARLVALTRQVECSAGASYSAYSSPT